MYITRRVSFTVLFTCMRGSSLALFGRDTLQALRSQASIDPKMAEATISHDHEKSVTMDSEKQAAPLAHDKVDAALEFLNAENTSISEVDEKELVRKIDWRIVPLMCKSSSRNLWQDNRSDGKRGRDARTLVVCDD